MNSACIKTLLLLLLVVGLAIVNPANAQSRTFFYGSQTFPTKGAAEAAMYAAHERHQYYTIESVTSTSMTTLKYSYSAPDLPHILGDWAYGTGLGGSHLSEQDSVNASIDYYENQLLQNGGCAGGLSSQTAVSRASWEDLKVSGADPFHQKGVPSYSIVFQCTRADGSVADLSFGFTMYRTRPVSCPPYFTRNGADGICFLDGQLNIIAPLNSEECGRGNPFIPATGDKYQRETDYSQAKLAFTRSFHTQSSNYLAGFGKGWTHNFGQRLLVPSPTSQQAVFVNENGFHIPLRFTADAQAFLPFDGKSQFSITKQANEWAMQRNSSEKRIFNENGRLIRIEENQHQIDLIYDADATLTEVSSSYGHSLNFVFDEDNRVTEFEDSQGNVYQYSYDNNDNLITVIYPDTTPNDNSDNPSRIYHYENPSFPNHLTGITDENGVRYATYAYDANGLAISTEHAQTTNPDGQEKFELDYQGAN